MNKTENGTGKKAGFSILPFQQFGKDKFIIMILVGILLFIIAIPVDSKKNNSSNGKVQTAQKQEREAAAEALEAESAGAQPGSAAQEEYVTQLEKRLSDALAYMDGAGKVKVMITLQSSAEKVVEKDTPGSRASTAETDAEGGRRSVNEMESGESTVYVTGENGVQTPYVVKHIEPKIEGVIVIAQGGGSAQVRQNITEAVQALFNIEAQKVKVVKMKQQ